MIEHIPVHSLSLLPAPGPVGEHRECLNPSQTAWAPCLPAATPCFPASHHNSYSFPPRETEVLAESFVSPVCSCPTFVGFAPSVPWTSFSSLGSSVLLSLRKLRCFESHLSLPPKLICSLCFTSKMWSHIFKLQICASQIQPVWKLPWSASLPEWVSPFSAPGRWSSKTSSVSL